MTTTPHVVKIGGSLLAEPGAMARVAEWLDATRRPGETRLLVAGGGPVVDGLRAIDRANPLDEAASHGAAVRLMDANTRLAPAWLAGVVLAATPRAALDAGGGDHAVLVETWLRDTEPAAPGERLAVGWQTTSDAIAARLAVCFGARLTLLKHPAVGVYDDLLAAEAAGVVDPECPRVGRGLTKVRVLGLPERADG